MNKASPADIERAKEQLREGREVQARLDPDGAPVLHPWRTTARNSAIAVSLIGMEGARRLITYRPLIPNTAWWVWFALGGFAVAVCFGHEALGLVIGRRRAANILKIMLAALLVGIAVWFTHQDGTARR
jgi:hypothetical protein